MYGIQHTVFYTLLMVMYRVFSLKLAEKEEYPGPDWKIILIRVA